AERVDRRAKRAVQRGEDKLAHIARVEGEAEPPGVGEVGLWNRRGAQRSGIEFSRATWAPPRREMRELDGSSGRIVDQPRYATLTRGAQDKINPHCGPIETAASANGATAIPSIAITAASAPSIWIRTTRGGWELTSRSRQPPAAGSAISGLTAPLMLRSEP